MINWLTVVANSFWLVGLALILAVFSYYYWQAGQLGRSLWQELGSPLFQRLVVFGLLLVGIGLALTADGLGQSLPALALILVCLIALFTLLRERRDRRSGG